MTEDRLLQVSRDFRQLLEDRQESIPLPDAIVLLRERFELDENEARDAIWQLLQRDDVELTSELEVKHTSSGQPMAAAG